MSQLLLQVLSILTEPSGDLIFHLVQIFSALAALLLALSTHQDNKSIVYRRFLLGIIVVLASQLTLFLITTFGWRGYFDTHLILPILDRTVNTLCMVWIIWLWVAPQPWKVADFSLIGLNILIGVFFLVTIFSWIIQGSGVNFNSTWQDLIWADLMVLTIVAGLIGLIIKKPDGWGVGVGFLAINLTGLAAHLAFTMQPGDYVGIVRLVQVFTYPLLPVLTRRFTVIPPPVQPMPAAPIPSGPPERTRFTAESRTIDTWLQLSAQERSEPFHKLLVKAIAQTMVADICLLMAAPDPQGQVRIFAGYDLIRQETFGGGNIKRDNIPEIVRGFEQNLPLIMLAGGPVSKDLKTFRDALNLKAPSNSMFIPILYHQEPIAGLLVCSPYSARIWDITDESYLYSVTNRVGALLAEIGKREENLDKDDLSGLDEEEIREKYSLLKQENIALVTEIDVLQKTPELPAELPAPASEPPLVIALPAVTSTTAANQGNLSSEEEENLRTERRSALEEVSRLRDAQAVSPAASSNAAPVERADASGSIQAFELAAIRKSMEIIQSRMQAGGQSGSLEENLQTLDDLVAFLESSDPSLEADSFLQAIDAAILKNRGLLAQQDVALLNDYPQSALPVLATEDLVTRLTGVVLRNMILSAKEGDSIHLRVSPGDEGVLIQLSRPSSDNSTEPGEDGMTAADGKIPAGFRPDDWELVRSVFSAMRGNASAERVPSGDEEVALWFHSA